MMKVKKGDTVMVITGKDKGTKGSVSRVIPAESRVVVEGVNLRSKNVRAREGRPSHAVSFAAPIHVSNVALIDPKSSKPTRVGFVMKGDKKVRVAKKSGAEF